MTHAALEGLLGAARRSARSRQQSASTAHVLLTILQSDPECSRLLASCQVREQDVVAALRIIDEEPTSALEVAIERATAIAQRGGSHARPLHLLFAMLREPRSTAYRCLEQAGVNAGRVREELESLMMATRPSAVPDARPRSAPPPPARSVTARPPISRPQPVTPPRRVRPEVRTPPVNRKVPAANDAPSPLGRFSLDPRQFPVLSAIGRNLTELAASHRLDPVLGREREIEQVLDVLARRRANNPLLLGPPGVGKTAIVEGLAIAIAEDKTPALSGKRLIEVSVGALLSGTGVRGALADKLRRLRDEVAGSASSVVLFLDEIHAIGAGEGPDDLASELKAALARGELPCIGATTHAEFERFLARDPALARRFTRIFVEPPAPEVALEILAGIAPSYEKHHSVAFAPEAIAAAVELTVRYLPERHLPDKALAALDLAAARTRRAGSVVVELEAVAKVIADEAHVPLDRLLVRDADRLLALEHHLEERVVGQREAITRIADALRKSAAGFRGKRPLGTFLLLGPTGVGKTETAKAIADLLFGPGGMSRFDMSELGESHAVARLLGAPPGYVGHDSGGQLTEAVRRRPYQLVLLDEIEKAHPDVLLALLPLLDEGRLTDGKGRTVDFTNTVIVMTSNLGAEAAVARRSIGFGSTAEESDGAALALAAARRAMPPELWNRIDEPLFFRPLSPDDVRQVARRMTDAIGATLAREHGVTLDVEPAVLDLLVSRGGFDPALGARPMRRMVGRLIESPLAERVLSGALSRGDRVLARAAGDNVAFIIEPDAIAAE